MTVETLQRPATLPGANDSCWCGSGRKYKRCHRLGDLNGTTGQAPSGPPAHRRIRAGVQSPKRTVPLGIARPYYADGTQVTGRDKGLPRDAETIAKMRVAGRAAAEVLAEVGLAVVPGMTTDELDRVAHEACIARGGYPSPLGYPGGPRAYPKSLCTSLNEVICHGIPDSTEMVAGDIVNCDVTIFLDGVHGDTNATFFVGGREACDAQSIQLVDTTWAALDAAISVVRPGAKLRDIGRAIQEVAEPRGYGVVRDFVGHGIAQTFHADPQVHHYYRAEDVRELLPGMTFTIEPMINLGTWKSQMWNDNWTAVTQDKKRSAQYEHTILVTEEGCDVLTAIRPGARPGEQP